MLEMNTLLPRNQKSQLPKSEGASFRLYGVATGDFKHLNHNCELSSAI